MRKAQKCPTYGWMLSTTFTLDPTLPELTSFLIKICIRQFIQRFKWLGIPGSEPSSNAEGWHLDSEVLPPHRMLHFPCTPSLISVPSTMAPKTMSCSLILHKNSFDHCCRNNQFHDSMRWNFRYATFPTWSLSCSHFERPARSGSCSYKWQAIHGSLVINLSFLCSWYLPSVLVHHNENAKDSDSDRENKTPLHAMWKAKVVSIYKTSISKIKIKVCG